MRLQGKMTIIIILGLMIGFTIKIHPTSALTSYQDGNYVLVEEPKMVTYAQANEYCASAFGSQLASIHSDKDTSIILGLFKLAVEPMKGAWIGLNDITREGTFVWMDGTPVDYTLWGIGEPNGGKTDNAVAISDPTTGEWNDGPETSALTHFVCNFDNVAPTVTIVSPSAKTYTSEPLVEYTVSDGVTTVYLDGKANTSRFDSGSYLKGLSDGIHVLNITAKDTVGNVGFSAVTFSIDFTAPTVKIVNPTPNSVHLSDVKVEYTVSDGDVTVYLNNIANASRFDSGSTFSGLTQGIYNLTITSIDAVGHIGKDIVFFEVDLTAPKVEITNPLPDSVHSSNVKVEYTVSDGIVMVFLNGTANSSRFDSGSIYYALKPGTYNLTIVSTDLVGNQGRSAVFFFVDSSVPIVEISNPLPDSVHPGDVLVEYTVSSGVVAVYLNDVANSSQFDSGSKYFGLTEGKYNLTIIATDGNGNQGRDTVFFSVDLTGPSIKILGPMNITYQTTDLIFNYTVSDGVTTVYLDGVANITAIISEVTINSLTEGSHNLTIVAVDSVGNIGAETVLFTVSLPTTPTSDHSSRTSETKPGSSTTPSKSESLPQDASSEPSVPLNFNVISVFISLSTIYALNITVKRRK